LLGKPDFTLLAMGDHKSGSALQPESGGSRGSVNSLSRRGHPLLRERVNRHIAEYLPEEKPDYD
jgi:hypothetical protein